jgi:hypothetical protein
MNKTNLTVSPSLIGLLGLVLLFQLCGGATVLAHFWPGTSPGISHKPQPYEMLYLLKEGQTSTWPGSKGAILSYKLRSFDYGQNWSACRVDAQGVHTLGMVSKVYPGLLAHVEGMDKVLEAVSQHGPFNLTNAADVVLLTKCGVIITNKMRRVEQL